MNGFIPKLKVETFGETNIRLVYSVQSFPDAFRGNLRFCYGDSQLLSQTFPDIIVGYDNDRIFVSLWGLDYSFRDSETKIILVEKRMAGRVLDIIWNMITDFNKSIGSTDEPIFIIEEDLNI